MLNFLLFLNVLLFVSFSNRNKKFPNSRRIKLPNKASFGGSKTDLDIGTDMTPPRPLSDKTDLELANELGILEVHKNGDQYITERSIDDIKNLRKNFKNLNRDINNGKDVELIPSQNNNKESNNPFRRLLTDLGNNEQIIVNPSAYRFAKKTGKIKLEKANGGSGSCTGILIGDKYVLTAAHCLHEGNGGEWFNNFDFYLKKTILLYSQDPINWNRAFIFNGWKNTNDRVSCDYSANAGYAAWGYSNIIEIGQSMGLYGYKGSDNYMTKTWGTISHLYDEAFCSDDSSLYDGQSGSGVYVEDGSTAINGVHANSCSTRNCHTRITSWKKAAFEDWME